ncbi:MAG: LysE family transporter [Pseudomonadota bacterium]
MHDAVILAGILGALLIGAVSPGPSFVMVTRIAVSSSRRNGLAAALGMGAGGALFASLAILGLATLLSQVGWLYLVFKIAGGAYLVYLGIRIWRHASEPLVIEADSLNGTDAPQKPASASTSFALAILTQISNPKTAMVYASIFASLLPAEPPLWMLLALPPLIFMIEAGWYATVALLFSGHRVRRAYLGGKTWVDRFASLILGALGVRLMIDGLRP